MSLGDASKALRKLPYGPIRVVYSCSKTDGAGESVVIPEIRTTPDGGTGGAVFTDQPASSSTLQTSVAVKRNGMNRSSTMSDSSGIGSHTGETESLNNPHSTGDNLATITLVKVGNQCGCQI
eukprot:sb/3475993/